MTQKKYLEKTEDGWFCSLHGEKMTDNMKINICDNKDGCDQCHDYH